MKKLKLLLLIVISISTFAQQIENKSQNKTTRNFFSLIPSKVDKINGLSLGVWAENLKSEKDSLKINGLNFEINPLCFFAYIRGIVSIKNVDDDSAYDNQRKNGFTNIDGINCSIPGFFNQGAKINGLSFTPLTICAGEINGISISGLTNCSYNMNGVSICGIYNSSNKVNGIQIGLFNRAKRLHGIQIGLWNKNGKRSLPLINWQFPD
jgi:hypothetical protein